MGKIRRGHFSMQSMNRGHVISKGLPDDGMEIMSRMTFPRNGNRGPWNLFHRPKFSSHRKLSADRHLLRRMW